MKISTIASGFLSAALLCGQASAAETDYAAGTRALPLQQSNGTARAMSMGSAVVAVPQGSASLLWNPAGLSRMSCTELGLHHNSGLGGTIQEIAVLGTPFGECTEEGKGGSMGGIAASLGYVNYGSFETRDALGVSNGNYHAGDYDASVGWGMELVPKFSGGVALKANHSNFGDKGYNAYAADIGFLWTVRSRLDLGLTYTNLNLGKNLSGSLLNSGWRLGAGWTVDKHWILAAAGELQDKAMNRLQLGTEYLIGNVGNKINVLALRAGYQANYPNPQLSGLTGLTWGLGYTLSRSLALDYAMLPIGELGTSHRVSLTFKFNCPGKPQSPAEAVAAAAPAADAMPAAAPVPASAPIVVPVEPPPVLLRSIALEEAYFDFDKSTLKPTGVQLLKDNIQIMNEVPKSRVHIAGYTSARGKPEYNQLLSERRAHAVKNYLVEEGGISPDRITTIGYGETRPAFYEATAHKIDMNSAAAKANMRVVLEITVK